MDGEAAAALGDLARRRWEQATGERLAPARGAQDPWPNGLTPHLRDVEVAIARTAASGYAHRGVREVETLFVESIAAARRSIFIECQYLASTRVGEALVARLREEAGPQVVIVTTLRCGGWLEELAMGVLRARLLRRLVEADRFGRLRVYCAVADTQKNIHIEVHSKVMVIDDTFLRVGSANMTNRSMSFDTECDLALEACGEDRIAQNIRRFGDGLLAEHLGTSPDRVAAVIAAHASLIGAVEALRGRSPHTLIPLDAEVPAARDQLIPERSIADPERPLETARLLEYFLHDQGDGPAASRWRLLAAGGVIAGLVLLAMLWTFSPLRGWATAEWLLGWADPIRHSPLAPLIVIGGYIVGALVVFPRVLLTLQTALIFGPVLGPAYALLGNLFGTTVPYGLGRALGRHTVRRLTGRRINRLSLPLARSGTLAVAAVRAVPLAPATVVSLVCGAAGVRFRHFILGTLLGSLPGLLALIAFGDQLGRTIRSPDPGGLALLAAMEVVIVGIGAWIRKRFRIGRPPVGGLQRLEIASYNIHRCIGLDRRQDPGRIAAVVREMAADVVALQEVKLGRAIQQPEHLSELTGFQLLLGPTMQRRTRHYGNVLLVRSPVLDARRIDLSVPGREPRGALDVDLAQDGTSIRVVATHFGLTMAERHRQVRHLLDALRNGPKSSIILLGDINERRPAAFVLRRLDEFFGRTWAVRTFPARYPRLALDRIWVRPMTALHALWAHVTPLSRIASDHLPVRAKIDLGRVRKIS